MYVHVCRLVLFIEESLYTGTQWAVFEPNDALLWARIRLSVGDRQTMTQDDIDGGIVNIVVGLAPLKPAAFVLISIRQINGA